MTTLYDPDKIAKLASTGDAFWRGAQWILDQQAASRLDPPHRAAFMSDRISMDEARARAMREGHAFIDPADYDQEWAPVRNSADLGAPRVP